MNGVKPNHVIYWLALLPLLLSSYLSASDSGAIIGLTLDSSGKTVPEATIRIEHQATGFERLITSNSEGSFRFPLLPEGIYTITGNKDGYQEVALEKVKVGISGNVQVRLFFHSDSDEIIVVTGRSVALIDPTSSEVSTLVDSTLLENVPIERDFFGAALMAPGAIRGDSAFQQGVLPSFSGSSVSENTYLVNGLNISNFINGLTPSEPPFEFFDVFEVKTGGYSAEFGRASGGVISARTKSGTNEFKWGINAYYEPESLRENKPSAQREDGTYRKDNRYSENEVWDANIWASGALVEDRLFYYLLFNPRDDDYHFRDPQFNIGNGQVFQAVNNFRTADAFWGVNLDWYINSTNILELTVFSDETHDLFTSDQTINGESIEPEPFVSNVHWGGKNISLKYTSVISEDLSISTQYGINEVNKNITSPLDQNPLVYFFYPSFNAFVPGGKWASNNRHEADDERKQMRIDLDWYLGDHELRIGLDAERLSAYRMDEVSGGVGYLIIMDDSNPMSPVPAVVSAFYNNYRGNFESENSAFYIQDQWHLNDQLVLNLGIRNDSFKNLDAQGGNFIDLPNNWAPRLGFVYDPTGEGESKIWGSLGRYYLPVASVTNIVLVGESTNYEQYYAFDGWADTELDIPNLTGIALSDRIVYANGEIVTDAKEITDANLDAMYSHEFILGYQFLLTEEWSMGIQGTYRTLENTIEDVAVDVGFNAYLLREFGSPCGRCFGFNYFVMANPGSDITISTDPDGPGPLEYQAYTIPAEDLGYPESIRRYKALDISVERPWDGQWHLKAMYTWSESIGNNEGPVSSDFGQSSTNLTSFFDQPGLSDGTYGHLPNDRTHQFKLFGAYQLTEAFKLGLNLRYQTGRPISAFGYHPTDVLARQYGVRSFYANGELVPRGTKGRTEEVLEVNLSVTYQLDLEESTLIFRADIFNLFNDQSVTEVDEAFDLPNQDYYTNEASGSLLPNPYYGLATNWQTPRYFRFSVSYQY